MPKSEVESNLWAYGLKEVCFILGFYYFYENILEGYGVIFIDLRSKYGSWALVAGASEGLGAAFAEALAHCGLNLILIARREQKLRELAAFLNKKYKVEVLAHALDLADIASVTEALEKDSLEIGVLVYNAAYAPIGSFDHITSKKLEMVVDVNVKGPLLPE